MALLVYDVTDRDTFYAMQYWVKGQTVMCQYARYASLVNCYHHCMFFGKVIVLPKHTQFTWHLSRMLIEMVRCSALCYNHRYTYTIYIYRYYIYMYTIYIYSIHVYSKSFNHKKYQNETELSKYVWKLKKKNSKFSITWKKISQATTKRRPSNQCNLCLEEKYQILKYSEKNCAYY